MSKDNLTPPRDGGLIRPTYYEPREDGTTNAGREIINAASSQIQQFVTRQRTAVALGGLDQHRTTIKLPDLDVEYVNIFGQERIRLTPRPTSPEPPTPVELVIETPDRPTFEEPTFEDVTTPTPCMLVLYKARKSKKDPTIVPHYAAIPMASLIKKPGKGATFTPIYGTIDEKADFKQPVLVGQYLFAGTSFIQTDVDLSGKGQDHSCLCTTYMFDAISMGRKSIPLMNSPLSATSKVPSKTPIQVYTSAGVYYHIGFKFTPAEPNQLTMSQPHGISQAGDLYYGAQAIGPQIATYVDQSSIDENDDAKQAAIDKAEDAINTWVSIYTLASVKSRVDHSQENYTNTENAPYVGHKDPKHPSYLYTSNIDDVNQQYGDTYLTIVQAVVPGTDPIDAPPEHQNQTLVTEILGEAYYGLGAYNAKLVTVTDIKIAHDTVPYYDFVFASKYYEYENAPNANASTDYSVNAFIMQYQPNGAIACTAEFLQASCGGTHTIVTDDVQPYPDYGGNLILGNTNDFHQTTFQSGPNKGLIKTQTDQQDTIAGHATNYPRNIGNKNPATLTYAEGQAAVQDCVAQCYEPTCTPNGEPGQSGSYQGEHTSHYYSLHSTPIVENQDGDYVLTGSNDQVTDTQTDDPGGLPNPPGYKDQHVDDDYNATLTWFDRTITASTLHTGSSTTNTLAIQMFPLHSTKLGYAVQTTMVSTADAELPTTYTVITPYKDFSTGTKDPSFQPWMHLGNKDHVLQGFIIQDQPYIYLDDVDVTANLAAALQCKATDIAACYFDIDLDAIKLIAKVK